MSVTLHSLPGMWPDVIVQPEGMFSLVSQDAIGGREIRCHGEAGGLLWTFQAAQGMRYLRASCLPTGEVCVIGQGQQDGAGSATFAACAGMGGGLEVWESNPNLRLRYPNGDAALRLHAAQDQITVIDAGLPVAYRDIAGNDVLWLSREHAYVTALEGHGDGPVYTDNNGRLRVRP